MSAFSRFSPAPADVEQTSDCTQYATVAEEAVEREQIAALDGNPFKLSPTYTRRMRRTMVKAVGLGVVSGIGVTITLALTLTDAHWSVGAIAGAASGYLLGTAINAAREMLGYQGLDRVIAQTARADLATERLESFGLRCELNAARQEANLIHTAYLFAVAAEAGAAPAEGEGGEYSPSAEVLFMNPHKPKAVH